MTPSSPRPAGWKAVQRFPENTLGNDYIVGDLHGAYDLLLEALRTARFKPSVDRLFLVGDLVDRGDESMRALRLLKLPYVFSIQGNHEATWQWIYAEAAKAGSVGKEDLVRAIDNVAKLRADWWFNADPDQRDELVVLFGNLPIAIEIETSRGLVGIVHADVPKDMAWPEFTAALEAGDEEVTNIALESRQRFKKGDESGVEGVGRVFVGHTVHWDGLKRYGNVYAVDSGAIFGMTDYHQGGRLTMAKIVMKTESLTAVLDNLTKNGLVDLRDDGLVPDAPFGNYAVPRGA